jgi:nicotinate-nucleotide adenylyltransferase
LHQRIGIMGGTFNPVHFGHLAAAEEVRERLSLDRVLFIPAFIPPHKQEENRATAAQRRDMVLLAIAGNEHFGLSDVDLKRGGTSYTIDTINTLRSSSPESKLFFITGLDAFLDIRTWHHWEQLLGLCAFVVLSRPGYHFSDLINLEFLNDFTGELLSLDQGAVQQAHIQPAGFDFYLQRIPQYDISSTDIRNRVREGRNIKYLLPESIEHYIIKNNLYA